MQRGVVAITKADLVDDELLQLVRADVAEFLAGTAYAQSPVVAVSARDGRGIPSLLGHLEEVSAAAARARREGPARLPVDRSFALKGIGTVVTGTVWRGEIRAGDALVVQPGGKQVTVRSVQVHDRDAEAALAGQRAGVNLRGVDKAEVERGQWLVGVAETGAVTRVFDAWIRLLPDARPLRSDAQVRLHHGTGQRLARLGLLGARELAPGPRRPARVRLDEAVALEARDRFITALAFAGGDGGRRRGARRGGAPLAQSRGAGRVSRRAAGRRRGARRPRACRGARRRRPRRRRPARRRRACARAGAAPGGRRAAWRPRVAGRLAGAAARRAPLVRARRPGAHARRAASRRSRSAPAERPERPFMPAAELAALAAGSAAAGGRRACSSDLVDEAEAVAGEGGYAAAGAAAGALSPAQETLAAAARERLAAAGLAPPTLATLAEELGASRAELERVLAVLTRRG